MKLLQLRRMIREAVETVLDEAESAKKKAPPASFNEFRKLLASLLKQAKAPADLVDEVGDTSDEGGGVANACFQAWDNVKDELGGGDEDWKSAASGYIHDAIIDLADEFNNSMNYAPGAKKGKKPVSGSQLAARVVDALNGGATPGNDSRIRDMANLVIDVLEASGAVYDVKWDRKSPTVTYRITNSRYLEKIEAHAERAGFRPGGSDEDIVDAWVDDELGLEVTFGDGVATIKKVSS